MRVRTVSSQPKLLPPPRQDRVVLLSSMACSQAQLQQLLLLVPASRTQRETALQYAENIKMRSKQNARRNKVC